MNIFKNWLRLWKAPPLKISLIMMKHVRWIIVFSNVRSIFNKHDEVSDRLSQFTPDIAMFCESWLDDSIPDAGVAWANYSVLRKDRNRLGGGIICYVSDSLHPSVLSCRDIPSLEFSQSDILPFLLPNLLFIGIYNPFWKIKLVTMRLYHALWT